MDVNFQQYVEQAPAITYVVSLGEPGGLMYISPQHEAITGFTRADWLDNPDFWPNRIHPADRERVMGAHARQLASGEPFQCEYRVHNRDNRELWVHDEATIVRDGQGKSMFIQGVVFDITERKQAELALAAENARLYRDAQALNEQLERRVMERTHELQIANQKLEAEIAERKQAEAQSARNEYMLAQAQQVAQVGSWQWDIAADVIHWSKELYRIFGLTQQEAPINYKRYLEFIHPSDRERVNQMVTNAYHDRKPFSFDHRIAHPDGSIHIIHGRGEVHCDEQGNPIRMVGTGQDITERKLAEDALHHSREQLRSLAAHLQSAREEERTRVAREIHDQLGQVLTALKMDLSLLGRRFADGQEGLSRQAVLQEIKAMSRLIDHSIQVVREIMLELRPEMLEDLGLRASIEWQVQEFETRTGIPCQFTFDVTEVNLDIERATAVFRILQEALTNVARHAKATQARVNLRHESSALVLEVHDNGRGIRDGELSKVKSFGILGMRERALLFGGVVGIVGKADAGTTLTVKIPHQDVENKTPV